MDKSIIKPNQCIHYGIPIFDDSTDKYCQLGLAVDGNLFIPTYMDGTTCGFDSRFPTPEEMDSCKRIIVSHETDRYSSTVHLNVSSVEKDNRYAIHAVSPFEDYSNHSICDIALEHQSTTSKLFISAVKITPSIIEIIDAVYGSNDRHHSPTADNIFMKWGCRVTAAKNILNKIVQEWIRSAVMPLTNQYCMNLLSQDLRQLITKLYTDMLFPKAKSVYGNTCAQIFTDNEHFFG